MTSQILNNINVRTLHIDAEPQSAIYTISNFDNNLTCGVIITREETVRDFFFLCTFTSAGYTDTSLPLFSEYFAAFVTYK